MPIPAPKPPRYVRFPPHQASPPYAKAMDASTVRQAPRTVTLVTLSTAVVLGAALVPVPGVLPAAVAGVLTCVVALTHSVRDALIATVVGAALLVIAVGAATNVALAVVFMGAVAVGVAAAMRVGRGTIALVIGSELALYVTGSVETGAGPTTPTIGAVAVAGGLLVCAGAVFVVSWAGEPPGRAPRAAVIGYLAVFVPVAVAATWASVTVLAAARGWGLAALLLGLAVAVTGDRSVNRLLTVIVGAFVAAAVVTVAGGVPVLVVAGIVTLTALGAIAGLAPLFSIALTALVLLLGSPSGLQQEAIGPEPLLGAIAGAFVAWGVLLGVAWLRARRASLTS